MPETLQPHRPHPWLRRFTKLLVAVTLVLIFLGGQVKSNEAGLAVPDWPTTYGQNMFAYPMSDWVGNIFHEHVHRLVASAVGMLCVILALWMALVETRPWVRMLGVVALGGVILQGMLGGLTVILMLPEWTSVSHGVLAQTFFMFTIFIAYVISKERRAREDEGRSVGVQRLVVPVLVFTGLVYLQLIAGALMRHTESGLALPDFPMMAGQWIPWFTQDSVSWVNTRIDDYAFDTGILLQRVTLAQLWIHFVHRLGALCVTFAAAYLVWRAWHLRKQAPLVWQSTALLGLLVTVQIALGITTVLTVKTPIVASFHVVTGASILGLATLNALRALPLTVHQFRRSSRTEQVAEGKPQEA